MAVGEEDGDSVGWQSENQMVIQWVRHCKKQPDGELDGDSVC